MSETDVRPGEETSDDFDFKRGARVRVRVREHGTTGTIEAKLDATVAGFAPAPIGSDRVRLDPPWDSLTGVTLAPHEAEYELLEAADE